MQFKGFKRFNFFKGLFAKAEDWQAAQQYHIDKQKLHNSCLHTPGIVPNVDGEELNVIARRDGNMVRVQPGYAINAKGQDLYLPEEYPIALDLKQYNPPTRLYIVIGYDEKETDPRENPANSRHAKYAGNAFLTEYPKVYPTTRKPDNKETIELARIDFRSQKPIKNPVDKEHPGPNEIDRTQVKWAGSVGVSKPIKLEDLGKIIINNGKIPVLPDNHPKAHKGYRIETVKTGDLRHFYLVNVWPDPRDPDANDDTAKIAWHIKTQKVGDGILYELYFENPSAKAVTVNFRVFRFD